MYRLVRWTIIVGALQAGNLALLAWLLPGFTIGNAESVILMAVLMTVGEALAWPFLYRLAGRLHPLLFPILSFALAGLLVVSLTDFVTNAGVKGLHVDGIGTGALLACGQAAGSTILAALFSIRDDTAYDWFVTRPTRNRYRHTLKSATPGIIFLEIDGLAEPILRKAIANGHMPTLERWLSEGSHRITPWEPDLSSQTSASQAGILLGDNHDIPAFRWYDKATGALMVSSNMATARELESRRSMEDGLLRDGASRWNVFSGGAPDSLCTYSTFRVGGRGGSGSYLAYFINPYTLPRAVALFVGDIVRERWQAWRQVRRNELPRIHRSWKYAVVRSATTTLMQEAGQFMLLSDLYRGVPAVYATFFAYDEVAHHSGIDRLDALKVLETMDRVVAKLERAASTAPRPYHLVVLSDHGQSMGPTFRQRHGQTLSELVTSLIEPGAHVTSDERSVEDWGHLNLALTEALHQGEERTARLLRRALRGRIVDGAVTLGPAGDVRDAAIELEAEKSDVVVLASGNLGLISFPHWNERLSYEQISDRFPTLIPGLTGHEGIGMVMVRSEVEGGLVIGRSGIHYLDHDYSVGDDPLEPYGPNAARHLKRTNAFSNAPDLLVMSRVDPATQEVSAFEELVGSHGGLGGLQTKPFVLHPSELDPGSAAIVGAGELHQVLARWLPKPAVETNV